MSDREYWVFRANGGEGPLIDHFAKRDEPRDRADTDVAAAVASLRTQEDKHRIASELGQSGAEAMEGWSRRISEVGPNAATEAARLYASAPRYSAPEEEERDESDHMRDARRAVRTETEKANRQASMPAALASLDRLEQRHGGLGVVDTFRRWNDQLQANPHDAAPRVAREIAETVNSSILDQQALQTIRDYEAKHKVSPDERIVMQRVLQNGVAHDLPSAHRIARHETAADVDDPFKRDVVAAQRQAEAHAMDQAKLTVRDWDARHPNVGAATKAKMQKLLQAEKARDLDEAYAMATRR